MDDINGVPIDEYKGPTFSINLHNHANHLVNMADEIKENLQL